TTRRHRVERAREGAEDDPQVCMLVGEVASLLLQPRPRVDAGELDAPTSQLHDLGVVEQHRPVLEATELDGTRKRIARDCVIMIAEHDVWMGKLREQGKQLVLPAGARERL